jgi:hypothetical protein
MIFIKNTFWGCKVTKKNGKKSIFSSVFIGFLMYYHKYFVMNCGK